MFKLINVENKVELGCSVVGYQFPDNPSDDWCMLEISVMQNGQEFHKTDPALEAQELVCLREWFECLSSKILPRYSRLSFTEPCIGFEFLAHHDGLVRIAIHLAHELKPPFLLEQFRASSDEWRIVFELDVEDFRAILSGINSAISTFPVRGVE